jgi:predicted Zn-dependent peptidase
MEGLFQNHPYGTQTTIGTVEHLKSPSITAIKNYFNKNYVANNMAVCMSGDLDSDKTIALINKYFGDFRTGTPDFATFKAPKESPIQKPVIKEVLGPSAESVLIGFRMPGFSDRESFLMEITSMILANSEAGLIDLNLNQKQKVLGAYSYPMRLKDYSIHLLAANPKADQSLEEVKNLLLSQLEIIKKGEFDDWLLPAIVNDYKLSEIKAFESNKNRANSMVSAFIYGEDWSKFILENNTLGEVTKQDIIDFANKYYKENYVVVYKKAGTDTSIEKVNKPKISPVSVNREAQSDFYKNITEAKTPKIEPVFVNFEKDITFDKLTTDIPIHYKKNKSNELFSLKYLFDFGSDADLELDLAIDYLEYLGNDKYSAEELKKEFYKLGCSYSVFASGEKVYVSLSGLNENFEKALKLFESFLKNPKANNEALSSLIDRKLKGRADQKLSKRAILNSGLVNYAKYGDDSPFKNFLTEEELRKLKGENLTDKAKNLYSFQHKVLYYGPLEMKDLKKNLYKYHHKTKKILQPALENRSYKELDFSETEVFFVNYDMVQAEVIFLSKSIDFDVNLVPTTRVFNEYFGGSMGSIVFQELRESKALAYSVRSYYSTAKETKKPNYVVSYIGAQNDKLIDAIDGMNELLNEMPKSDLLFQNAKDALMSELETNRTTKASVLWSYEQALKYGLDYDIRSKVYQDIGAISLEDIKKFHEKYMANQKQKLLIIGNKKLLDLEGLKKYGKVTELSLEQIFGY